MITPNMPMPRTNAHTEQMAMIGFLNRMSGITGSDAFDSAYKNAASIANDNASKDSTRMDVQPYCVAQVSASSSGTTQPMSVVNPAQSSCRVAPRGFMCGNSK